MKKDELKKEITGLSAFVMVIGTIIGSGIFFQPRAVFGATGSASLGLFAWLLGGLLALAGGLTIAEIGTLIPETGGMMTYMERIYGKLFGYLLGWAQSVVFYPVRFAAGAVICATQIVSLFGMEQSKITIIAVVLIVFINIINACGNKATDLLQNVATFLKFIPIIVLIIAGLFVNPEPVKVVLFPMTNPANPFWQAISISLIATLYATDGWMNVTNIAGEMKNPGKDLPKAIIGGISIVTVVYVVINIAYLRVLSPAALGATATPAADIAGILFPSIGGKLITVGILISVFGSLTGFIRAGLRVPYALALRGLLPYSKFFSKVNKTTGMPINSGLLLMVLTIIMIIFVGDFNMLANIGSFVIWFFYILTFVGVFLLRKKWPLKERPYKVPLYPFVPLFGIFGGVFVLGSTIIFQPFIAVISIGFTVAGIPLYMYLTKKKENEERLNEN